MKSLRDAGWLICLLAIATGGCSDDNSGPVLEAPDPTNATTADAGSTTDEQLDVAVINGVGFITLVRTSPLDGGDLRLGSAVSGELIVDPDTGCLMVDDALLVLPHGSTVGSGADAVSVEGYPPFAVGDLVEGPGVTMSADALITPGTDIGTCQVTADQAVSELYVPGPND